MKIYTKLLINCLLTVAALSTDPTTGELHRRHHVTKDGYYKGQQVIESLVEFDDEDDE